MAVEGNAFFQKDGTDERLYVHFNPASLKVSLTNQIQDPPDQHTKPTTAKLDVELLFDTTETGSDVRTGIELLYSLATATGTSAAQGSDPKQQANHSLPSTIFQWGTTKFTGVIESLSETLDYWSSDGVPLRATVQVGMKGSPLARVEGLAQSAASKDNPVGALNDVVPTEAPANGTGATGAASQGGDSKAGRMLAALNGLENMRAPTGAALGAAAGISLSAAAGFKLGGGISAGAGAGFGIGASAGASIGAGLGASVGVGMAAGAGIGAGAGISIGASAGIGIGASAGIGIGASAGIGIGASAGIGIGASAGVGMGASAGAGIGMGTAIGGGIGMGGAMGAGVGMGAGGGLGITTSSSVSMTGLDGVTRTESHSSFTGPLGTTSSSSVSYTSGSATAGLSASQGAFAGLGVSKTTAPGPAFDPNRFLGPPSPPVGPFAQFDTSGRLVTSGGQVAASYAVHEKVVFF